MLRFFSQKPQLLTDSELVQKYKSSDKISYLGVLYERYMEMVYGVCLKYLKDHGKAEDGVMSIFEELTTKVKKHDIQTFKSWLHTVTKNYCLMQLRKENKKSLTIFYDNELVQSADLVHPEEEVLSEDKEDFEALKHCIKKLPGKQQRCIKLFYLDEQSYKDIADTTGLEIGKVRSYIQNGRRNLKKCIKSRKKESSSDKLTQ